MVCGWRWRAENFPLGSGYNEKSKTWLWWRNVFNGKSSQGWEELARLLPIKDLLKLIQSLVLLSPSFASPNS